MEYPLRVAYPRHGPVGFGLVPTDLNFTAEALQPAFGPGVEVLPELLAALVALGECFEESCFFDFFLGGGIGIFQAFQSA